MLGKVYTAEGVRDATLADHAEWLRQIEEREAAERECRRIQAEMARRRADRPLIFKLFDRLHRWADS